MATTRRGFLKLLGSSGAVIVPTAAGHVIGVELASGPDRTAFNFSCSCGRGHVAEVPKEIDTQLTVDCECGMRWRLTWKGDHFQTRCFNRKEVVG